MPAIGNLYNFSLNYLSKNNVTALDLANHNLVQQLSYIEIIRNYMERDQIPVKILGAGRGKDYDWLGWSHWAVDDADHMSGFKNIKKVWPEDAEAMEKIFKDCT